MVNWSGLPWAKPQNAEDSGDAQALYHDLALDRNNREIRVLDLPPGRFGAALRAELRIVSLDERPTPRYEALSYTWGVAAKGRFVVLHDSVKLPITDNLYDALQRLRRRRTMRTLWVDAICINQTDNAEKGHQVRFMGEIYRRAGHVAIWLGDTWRSVFAPRWLRKYPCTWAVAHLRSKAFRDVVTREGPQWIHRVWTRQEFLLANLSTLHFGSNALAVPSHFETVDLIAREMGREVRNFDGCRKFWDLLAGLYSKRGVLPTHMGLAASLLLEAAASDPRDRIYALLAVLNDEEAGMIEIDYDRPCAWVYAQATRAGLVHLNSLMTLGDPDVVRHSEIEALPSWAVDFSVDRRPQDYVHNWTTYASVLLWPEYLLVEKGVQPLNLRSEEWNVLRLTGVEIGIVIDTSLVDTSLLIENRADSAELVAGNVSPFATFADLVKHAVKLQQNRNVEITGCEVRDLLEDILGWDEIDPKGVARGLLDVMFALWDRYCPALGQLTEYRDPQRFAWLSSQVPLDRFSWIDKMWDYVNAAGWRPAIAVTSQGALVVSTEMTRVGDHVVFCQGSERFFILREEQPGEFRFLGLALIHGYLDADNCVFEPPDVCDIQEYRVV